MSVQFVGGPLDGRELSLQRGPLFIRGVVNRGNGRRDALDLLDDEPRPNETVSVYQLVWRTPTSHICSRGEGCTLSYMGTYRWREDVDGEQLRDTEAWRAWAQAEGHEHHGVPDLARRRAQRAGAL